MVTDISITGHWTMISCGTSTPTPSPSNLDQLIRKVNFFSTATLLSECRRAVGEQSGAVGEQSTKDDEWRMSGTASGGGGCEASVVGWYEQPKSLLRKMRVYTLRVTDASSVWEVERDGKAILAVAKELGMGDVEESDADRIVPILASEYTTNLHVRRLLNLDPVDAETSRRAQVINTFEGTRTFTHHHTIPPHTQE